MNGFGDETFEFAQGSVFGFRTWITSVNENLVGYYGTWWKGPALTAECIKIHYVHALERTAPHPECTCGIYAYWSPGIGYRYTDYAIGGVIEGTGRTIVGTKGFRTQHASIKALCLGPFEHADFSDSIKLINAIADSFGVTLYDNYEDMIADYPLTIDYLIEPRSDSTAGVQ